MSDNENLLKLRKDLGLVSADIISMRTWKKHFACLPIEEAAAIDKAQVRLDDAIDHQIVKFRLNAPLNEASLKNIKRSMSIVLNDPAIVAQFPNLNNYNGVI